MNSPEREYASANRPHATSELLCNLQRLANTNRAFRNRCIGEWSVSLAHNEPIYTHKNSYTQKDRPSPETISTEYMFSVLRPDDQDPSTYSYEYGYKSSLHNTVLPDNLMQYAYDEPRGTSPYTPFVKVTHSVGVSIDTASRQLDVSHGVEYFDDEDELLVSADTDLGADDEPSEDEGCAIPLQFRVNAARLLETSSQSIDTGTAIWLQDELSRDELNLDIAHVTLRSMKRAMRMHLSMKV